MKKTVSILLLLVLVLASVCSVTAAENGIDYSQWDTNSSYPSDVLNTRLFTPVKFLVDKKIVQGYEDGLFHPDWNVTRAEYIKMVLIATNNTGQLEQYANSGEFADASGHWADKQGYIGAGTALGLINGYPDGSFKPDDKVTYAEMGAIWLRTRNINDAQLNAYGKWPSNVETYLEMYNMLGDFSVDNWNDAATRGNVAKFLYKNLPK